MSRKRFGARPQRNELMVKIITQPMNSRLRPNSIESQPVSGSTIAFEIRYEVRTQVLSSTVAERLPAICGSETLAMLVSSTSMKVASITVAAINQGLTLGVQGTAGFATGVSTEATVIYRAIVAGYWRLAVGDCAIGAIAPCTLSCPLPSSKGFSCLSAPPPGQ